MRCPKCGYTSFDHNETCPKCNRSVVAVRDMLGLLPVAPVPIHFLASLLEEEGLAADVGRPGQKEVPFQERGASTLDEYMYEGPDEDDVSTAGEVVLEAEEMEESGLSLEVEDHEIAFSMDDYGQQETGGTETDRDTAPTETDGHDMDISFDAEDMMDDGQIDEDLETLAMDMDEAAGQSDEESSGTLELELEPDESDDSSDSLELEMESPEDDSGEYPDEDDSSDSLELELEPDTEESLPMGGDEDHLPGLELETDAGQTLEFDETDTDGGPYELELEPEPETDQELLDTVPSIEYQPGETLEVADEEDSGLTLELADEEDSGLTLELADEEDSGLTLELADEDDSPGALELSDLEPETGEDLVFDEVSGPEPVAVGDTLDFDDDGESTGPLESEGIGRLELKDEDGGTLEFELEPDLFPATAREPQTPSESDLEAERLETLTLSGPGDLDSDLGFDLEGEQETLDLRDLEPAAKPFSLEEEPEGEELELEELEEFGFDEEEIDAVSTADDQVALESDFSAGLDVENLLENEPELELEAPEEEPGPFDLEEEDALGASSDLDLTELYMEADQVPGGAGARTIDPESTVVIDAPPQEQKPDTAEVDTLGLEESTSRPTDSEDFELDMADLELGLDDSELNEAANDLSERDLDDEIDNLEVDLDDLSLDLEEKEEKE